MLVPISNIGYRDSVYSFDLVGPNFDATLTLDLDPHPLGLAVSIVSLLTFVPAAWRPSTAHPPSLPACPPARQNDICYIEFLICLVRHFVICCSDCA